MLTWCQHIAQRVKLSLLSERFHCVVTINQLLTWSLMGRACQMSTHYSTWTTFRCEFFLFSIHSTWHVRVIHRSVCCLIPLGILPNIFRDKTTSYWHHVRRSDVWWTSGQRTWCQYVVVLMLIVVWSNFKQNLGMTTISALLYGFSPVWACWAVW